MQLPLSFWDFGLWLAIVAITVPATTEIVSPYYGEATLFIDKNLLATAALILVLLFRFTVAVNNKKKLA